ncbi:peptidylprolyl isomerase [Chthonobacter albigriseus]|uniref:peptidylprolyl isomerase n=1 Tax=Chthonobacter albigriseus TaxID=1683161 RepID=UPI0015EE56FA|nr:peptidylprolyl isomerase [Chthonobacter albigriseus]
MIRSLIAAAAAFVLLAVAPIAASAADPENTLVLETTKGRVVIALRPDLAPKHVAHVKALVGQKFYDGIVFHRVIDGFMAQTGDPTGTGMGGSDLPDVPAEFTDTHFGRGVVGAARSQDPDSANSQFFIMFADGGFLNGQYTVWGEVTEGMENVDKINKGEPPADPDKIVTARLASQP